MRITQIIQGVHSPSAGPTYSVARLASELYTMGNDSSVLTLGARPIDWPHITPLHIYSGGIERSTGLSPGLMNEIRKLSLSSCILHGHGIWRIANLFPLLVARDSPAKITYSPRGTLSNWSMRYKSALKKPFWKFLQKPALERCDCFHATSGAEFQDIRRVGLTQPVAVIPNGIDIPPIDNQTIRHKQLLFLSRINPVKGLDILLPAWEAIAHDNPDWELIIAGPLDSDYAVSISKSAIKSRIPNIRFVGEMLGEAKRDLLFRSALFVLPSYSENFAIAVAEALAHGMPVITTTGTPWPEIAQRNAGWYIQPNVSMLTEALQTAMSQPLPALQEMGMNGRKWMEENYAWGRVASMMLETYEWLLHDDRKPEWVFD